MLPPVTETVSWEEINAPSLPASPKQLMPQPLCPLMHIITQSAPKGHSYCCRPPPALQHEEQTPSDIAPTSSIRRGCPDGAVPSPSCPLACSTRVARGSRTQVPSVSRALEHLILNKSKYCLLLGEFGEPPAPSLPILPLLPACFSRQRVQRLLIVPRRPRRALGWASRAGGSCLVPRGVCRVLLHVISPCFTHGINEQWGFFLDADGDQPGTCSSGHYAPAWWPPLPAKLLFLPLLGWSFLLPWGLQDNLQIK